MNSNGTVGTVVYDADWSDGWTSAAFYEAGGQTYMLLLKSGMGWPLTAGGEVHFHRMNADGTVGARIDTRNWRPGWTTVEPYSVDGSRTSFCCSRRT